MLCHILLIFIVLSTYAFISFVHSMFHLFIQVCLSYIHTIYDFHGYILYHLLCYIFMYYYHVLFHVFISYTVLCFTFHITFSFILAFHIILHSYTFSYIMSDRIISCYKTCHHIAGLCFSYHIISFHMSYSNQLFYVLCLHKPYKWIKEIIRARKRCTHCVKQWSIRA